MIHINESGFAMVSKVCSAAVQGIDGHKIVCECDLSTGLPAFDIVGLPDAAVRESRDRVRAAIKNCGFDFPMRRITVNLAPAELRKEGTTYDLPVMVGILAASGQLPPPPDDACFIGELSLNGELRAVSGVLPMALAAHAAGLRRMFVPASNAAEASIAGGVEVLPVAHFSELAAHLDGQTPIPPAPAYVFRTAQPDGLDFSDVMGQDDVKRALTIAAAGSHNVLLIGAPGSGKSMLAKRLPSILPDLTAEEALEVTKIYSVAGLLGRDTPMIGARPFRSPHHTVSAAGLSGGGRTPRPGEVSLAHNGVLFLDELPEFGRDTLDVLRQPLEDGVITISRVAGSCTYPSRISLVCAMNPCKCGYYGHPSNRCTCSDQSVQHYLRHISGPLLDRIDLHVHVPSVSYESLSRRVPAERSSDIRARVNAARARQSARYHGQAVACNAQLTPPMMAEFCQTDDEGQALLKGAFEALGLTARAYDRILKVARTIADLDAAERIAAAHIAEAIQYRTLDRGMA